MVSVQSEKGAQRPIPWFLLPLLGLSLCALALAELSFGPVAVGLKDIFLALTGQGHDGSHTIVAQIRAPRVLLGLAVGAALALSGCTLQGILRNPLADPGLIGVTGGASVGAVATIVLGGSLASGLAPEIRPYLLPVAAFAGAALVTAIVFTISRRSGGTSVATLILAGVAVEAIAFALIGAMVYISDDRQLRDLTFWTMGSLANSDWAVVMVTCALAAASSLLLLRNGRALDLFQIGERAAFHSGLAVERVKFAAAALTALAVGGVTAAAGPIGFIGLVAPHIARLLIGPSHKFVLPASALIGGMLVLGADFVVRNIIPPAEPPIGLATSLMGGPFFLWLLLTRMRGDHA